MADACSVGLINVIKRFQPPEGGMISAVDNISLQVTDGEFFALPGPPGSKNIPIYLFYKNFPGG